MLGSSFTNTGTMTINGGTNDDAGSLGIITGSTFTNAGTMTFFGSEGDNSGRTAITGDGSSLTNECTGIMNYFGGMASSSGRLSLFTNAVLINNGLITLTGGQGFVSGSITTDFGALVTNHNTIIENGGPGNDSGIIQDPNGVIQDPILCPVQSEVIGGEIIPIDATSLLLTNTQTFSWMIPVVLSVLGIGLFVVSRKSE